MTKGAMREGVITEADTCREFVTPRLIEAGWSASPHAIGEQRTFTNGRIIVAGGQVRRGKQKRADYLLYFRRDFPLAVVEAKEVGLPAESGVQQARDYAEILGLKFAYATNGHRIIEIDYTTGTEQEVECYATPAELFARLTAAAQLPASSTAHLLEPFNLVSGKVPRYYQQIAIHRVIEAILLGQKRILATLATGTGKTCIAFQLCWKLWNSRWNSTGEYRRPKILFLADRNLLVDDPMAKMFAPFGDARHKIAGGDVSQSRDMYFGIYQALTTANEEVFRQYRSDFFDLIIIDECHRGSSRDESSWRAVLDYFEPAVQFGMTATHCVKNRVTPTTTLATRSTPTACDKALRMAFLRLTASTALSPPWMPLAGDPAKTRWIGMAEKYLTTNTRPRTSSGLLRCARVPGRWPNT